MEFDRMPEPPDPAVVFNERRSTPNVQVVNPPPVVPTMGMAGLAATISNMTSTAVMFVFLFVQNSNQQQDKREMMARVDANQAVIDGTLKAADKDRAALMMLIDKNNSALVAEVKLLAQEIRLTKDSAARTERAVTNDKD